MNKSTKELIAKVGIGVGFTTAIILLIMIIKYLA